MAGALVLAEQSLTSARETPSDVRSLAGSIRGDGNFMLSGTRYPFRVSSGQGPDGNGTRVHLNIDPGQRPLAIDLDGVLNFDARAPRFEGAMTLVAPPGQKGKGNDPPWRIGARSGPIIRRRLEG